MYERYLLQFKRYFTIKCSEGYCQNIKRSRQTVQDIKFKNQNVIKRKNEVWSKLNKLELKFQEAIDRAQLNKQKRKYESEDDSETPIKRQRESSPDSGTSQKRQCESSPRDATSEKRPHEYSTDDSEIQEKRQRLAEASNHSQ